MGNKHLGRGCAFHACPDMLGAHCSISHVCTDSVISCFSQNPFCSAGKLQLVTMGAAASHPFLFAVLDTGQSWPFSAERRRPHHGLSRALLVPMVLNGTRSKATRHSPCCLDRGKVSPVILDPCTAGTARGAGAGAEQETFSLFLRIPEISGTLLLRAEEIHKIAAIKKRKKKKKTETMF